MKLLTMVRQSLATESVGEIIRISTMVSQSSWSDASAGLCASLAVMSAAKPGVHAHHGGPD